MTRPMSKDVLLIYDAGCPYCTGIARAAGLSGRIRIEKFQQEWVQDLLHEVFVEPGFTMYLFTDGEVYWG
ncbi:MAG: hypothetical protein SVU32_03015, partial [Candidatus Nanohaloarchaea archaeon]|nr:hypothetical protein [Candidatus Nanohaloarchaea archaeon]